MKTFILVFVAIVANAAATCPHEGPVLQKWSEYDWARLPAEGQDLTINDHILLDVDTPSLGRVTIESGSLVWSPDHQVSLTANSVRINNEGSLIIGSEDCPYERETSITLTGSRTDDPEWSDETFGEKFIGVDVGGSLEIHGEQNRLPWTKLAETLEKSPERTQLNVQLADDVSSWRVGDKVVITSTDFDHAQAEVFEIAEVRGNFVDLIGFVHYTHFGQVWETIDMRAEVGLLSRNIKISGEIENGKEPCLGELSDCLDAEDDFDVFGGHTMAVEGFKSYAIRGAELYHMGQAEVLGRYPIHFHMAHDTSRAGVPSIISENAIHDTFSRCITVHGSHNVELRNNVAFNHFGHCYFLEDGGEKNTMIIGNLGLGTKKGELTPGDMRPTTFWITSPLTTLKDNVAAGSDNEKGFGIWFLFPDEPVGPSKGLGFLGLFEAKYTPITAFDNNVAHSNGETGFGLFRRLGENHEVVGCSTYSPRVDPLDSKSDLSEVTLSNLVAYKNRKRNVRCRSRAAVMKNFKLADSRVGIEFERNMFGGYQLVMDSVIAGETPNVGNDFTVVVDGELRTMNRSYPERASGSSKTRYSGILINAQGPSIIENVSFLNFYSNDFRLGTGIEFDQRYRFVNGARTSAKGVSYNYPNSDDGLYIYVPDIVDPTSRGDREVYLGVESMSVRDLDGSISGISGSTIVMRDASYLSAEDNCRDKPEWNMKICDTKFAHFFPPSGTPGSDVFLTSATNPSDIQPMVYERTGFTLAVNDAGLTAGSEDRVKIINYNGTESVDGKSRFRMVGLDTGESVTVGICLPMEISQLSDDQFGKMFKGETALKCTSSLTDLVANPDEKINCFMDKTKGVFYRRFVETKVRGEDDLGDCIGQGIDFNDCPYFAINFNNMATVDHSGFNCVGRF